jgi:hypothetical protein
MEIRRIPRKSDRPRFQQARVQVLHVAGKREKASGQTEHREIDYYARVR